MGFVGERKVGRVLAPEVGCVGVAVVSVFDGAAGLGFGEEGYLRDAGFVSIGMDKRMRELGGGVYVRRKTVKPNEKNRPNPQREYNRFLQVESKALSMSGRSNLLLSLDAIDLR